MSEVFTDYVESLSATGETLDLTSYDEAREHLRALLVTEMRRRGLWTSPPSYLGVTAGTWNEPEALEELVTDAYTYIFLHRLRGMVDQLRVQDNIRGLVVRNVRNFLTDRQRKADPLGYRVFNRLRKALRHLLDLGRIFLCAVGQRAGSPSHPSDLQNGTELTFSRSPVDLAPARAFDDPVARWNDALMPRLVTAEGRAVPKVVAQLADEVTTLPEEGIEAFRLEHLVKALKDDARRRWHALWDAEQETLPVDGKPGAERVPVERPNEEGDWPRFQAVVLACVERTIDTVRQAKKQADLWQVWTFVRSTRVDAEIPREMPSFSALNRELGMPRERVAKMLSELKEMVRRCSERAETGQKEHNTRSLAPGLRGAGGGGEDHA